MKIGVTTATVFFAQEHVNGDDQHKGLPARPGEAAIHHLAHALCARHGSAREAAAGSRLAPARDGRTPCRQRSQNCDGGFRPAERRPHGRGVPGRSRLLLAALPQARARGAHRLADHRDRGGAGPRRDSDDLLQPRQGLLAAGLDPDDRGILQPRTDAARLRGTLVPPADHAGGVCPNPVGGLYPACRQGRLASDRQRLGGQRRPLPALSGDEGAHPRHRLDGVHGPRAGYRPRARDQGEQGLHRHHPRRYAIIRTSVPPFTWWRGLKAREYLENYFQERVKERRGKDGSDLLTVLCQSEDEDGNKFSDEDIVNHMIFLMMAAHDTSTSTATTMSYYLAANPEWQERCRDESDRLGDGPLDIEALEKLESLDLVMNESLRLVSPVQWAMRRTVRDTELLGYYLPKDTNVIAYPGMNHRLSEIWTDPYKFDPDRFAEPRNEHKKHRFAFTPFGGGAHKCIGMVFGQLEIKTVMHRLLRKYRLEVVRPGYKPRLY